MALQPLWTLAFFHFLNLRSPSVGLLGRGISPSQGRYLHTEKHRQNKSTQTSMPRVGFEPTIPVFERAKTVHASDRAATVMGSWDTTYCDISYDIPQFLQANARMVPQMRLQLLRSTSFTIRH
jgi:hypothetical protein